MSPGKRRGRGLRRAEQPSLSRRARTASAALGKLLPRLVTVLVLGLLALLTQRGVAALYAQPVKHIMVTGQVDSRHRAALRETLAARIDSGLLALPLRELRDELESLPWVYRASLRRRFPETLELRVVEQRPIARWGDGGFLNHEARVIAVADAQQWQALPRIRGPQGSQAQLMHHYRRLQELLRPLALVPVSLEEDAFGQLAAQLDNGVALYLGHRDFARRVEDFRRLWRSELSGRSDVQRVDMRYASGAAVSFGDSAGMTAAVTGTMNTAMNGP